MDNDPTIIFYEKNGGEQMERMNTDLDLIDSAIDELHHILQDKSDGVGLIRVHEEMPVAEYYASLDDARKLPGYQNLVMTMAKDNLDRKTLRKVCYMRYEVMTRDEN